MSGKLEKAVEKFNGVIDAVEARCMAADGPVTPTLREMREDELRELWKAVQVIRKEATVFAAAPDLYAALKEFVECGNTTETMSMARAALARTTPKGSR